MSRLSCAIVLASFLALSACTDEEDPFAVPDYKDTNTKVQPLIGIK